jgi:hypothetical protein
MKRIIIILILVAVGGYFVYDYYQGKVKEKNEKIAQNAEYDKKREERQAAVAQMVSKYNASVDWMNKLQEGRTGKRTKILTMELENLWLINRPILFNGRIKDISNLDASNYIITLDGLRRGGAALAGVSSVRPKLALSLKSQKNMVDSLLSTHPEVLSGYFSSVAVIAKINKIETRYSKTEDGDEEEIKTGVGQCIDILFLR